MNNSVQMDNMCRACMCKNQKFHSLWEKASEESLRICEMFATAIPQVHIYGNEELPKKICVACLNILRIIHKFQQMCISSDTYLRNLLASSNVVKEQQVGIERFVTVQQQTVKQNKPLVDEFKLKSAIKMEIIDDDEAAASGVKQEPTVDNMDSEYKAFDSTVIKFEADEAEVQECDLKISLNTKGQTTNTVLLKYRDTHNDIGKTTELISACSTSTASEINVVDKICIAQFVSKKKLLIKNRKYKCYFCKVTFELDPQLEDIKVLQTSLCDQCIKDLKVMFIEGTGYNISYLVINNYLYNCQARKNQIQYWRCHNYSKKQQADRCRARCVIENGRLKKFTGESHNHLAHTKKIDKMLTRYAQNSNSISELSRQKFG